jgi:hypothetical protein
MPLSACKQRTWYATDLEDDTDKASEGQHEGRRDGKKPKHPGRSSGSIGGFIIAR